MKTLTDSLIEIARLIDSLGVPYLRGWIDEVGGMPLVKIRLYLTEQGIDIDVFLAECAFQESILSRRVSQTLGEYAIWFVTAEDLISQTHRIAPPGFARRSGCAVHARRTRRSQPSAMGRRFGRDRTTGAGVTRRARVAGAVLNGAWTHVEQTNLSPRKYSSAPMIVIAATTKHRSQSRMVLIVIFQAHGENSP